MKPTREDLRKTIGEQLDKALAALQELPSLMPALVEAADLMISTLKNGGKILTAGNGGSAADAMHMAEELSGRYKGDRVSLPGISLASDGTVLTCIGNDFGFDEIFARQVEGVGAAGDLLVLFSTSGNAANLSRALAKAREKQMKVLCILGRDGGKLAGAADIEVIVPGTDTEHIQEAHQIILHLMLGAVELAFPPDKA